MPAWTIRRRQETLCSAIFVEALLMLDGSACQERPTISSKEAPMELRGIDPRISHMLSERSTT